VRELDDELGEVILRPPAERIPCAHVKQDELVAGADTSLGQHMLNTPDRRGGLEHLDSVT